MAIVMSRNLATWKLLEDMMLELKKSGVAIPAKVVEDLRVAKSMIKLSCMEGSRGEALQKTEEILANVEAFVMNAGLQAFGSERVDVWLRQLEEAAVEVCVEPTTAGTFVVGVPRDQKWIRIEPMGGLTAERVAQLANEQNLRVKPQADGKLLVYGQQESIKAFFKRLVAESANRKPTEVR